MSAPQGMPCGADTSNAKLGKWSGCRSSLNGIAMCQVRDLTFTQKGKNGDMKDTMIGVDLAKNVFQLHGASMRGELMFRKKLTRAQFRMFMAIQEPAIVVMEACGSASYWAREFSGFGHEVRLISPQYVAPFVKRHKNDANDAEAIVIAAQRPEMRFVEPKTEEQQARAILFRNRERLVHQRTELINALRAVLYEFGYVIPQGRNYLGQVEDILSAKNSNLPELLREECRDLLKQISEKTERIDASTRKAKELAAASDTFRRLQTMPGVGPMTALAIEAFAPDLDTFRNGRDFSAWLGLVPRQKSSGVRSAMAAFPRQVKRISAAC